MVITVMAAVVDDDEDEKETEEEEPEDRVDFLTICVVAATIHYTLLNAFLRFS